MEHLIIPVKYFLTGLFGKHEYTYQVSCKWSRNTGYIEKNIR